VYISAPHAPLANITSICKGVTPVAESFTTSFFTRCVIVQNNSSIVAALSRADIVLTATATYSGPGAKLTKNRAASINIGLPGGWPISSLYPCEINSGQSQKLAVGSRVSRYVTAAMTNMSHPNELFNNL
jgi:hypothetical protein